MSLIDKEELYKFRKTIEWLSVPEDNFTIKGHPAFLLIERETEIPLRKPAAILMRKKQKHNSPEYCFLFYYSFFAYQIYIPFNINDENLDFSNFSFPLSALVVTDLKNLKEIKFNHYSMTELKKVKLIDSFRRNVK